MGDAHAQNESFAAQSSGGNVNRGDAAAAGTGAADDCAGVSTGASTALISRLRGVAHHAITLRRNKYRVIRRVAKYVYVVATMSL